MNIKKLGFTLIEILIAAAIVTILTLFSYQTYGNYLLKSHRVEATSALMQAALALEVCYSKTLSYQECRITAKSAHGYYHIALSNVTASTFTLTANAIGSQRNDEACRTLSVTETNQQTAFNSALQANESCWG
jgi:type IV pilus assembly protein PilE